MQNSKCTFEIELDKLLKEYFGEESFNKLSLSINYPKAETDGISEKINDFYREQLQINAGNYTERIKIDRTITFAGKKLEQDVYYKFLLELGRICVSGGKLPLATEIFRKANICSDKIVLKAESLLGLADVYSRRANWSKCISTITEAESLYKQIKDNIGMAKCENLLGLVFGEMGDIDSAKEHFLKSISIINPETDLEMVAHLELNLGIIDSIRGNTEDSLLHFKKALFIYNKLGNYRSVAEVNLNIGMVYVESEEYGSAIAAFDEGIKIAKESRFIPVLCLLYHAKSRSLIAINNLNYAAEFANKSLELSHTIDDKLTLADIYKVKGIIERHLKNFRIAENYLLSSLRINTALKNEMNIAETSLELALLYEEINNLQSKDSYLRNSLDYFKQINAFAKVRKIEEMLGTEAV